MRKSLKQQSAVPPLQGVSDYEIASLAIQIGEFAKMSQPIRVYGPASLWPIPHIKAAISLLVMVHEERSKLVPETAAYEASRLRFHLTAEKDVRHVDAKEATRVILGDDPTEYRRKQFAKFRQTEPYLAEVFKREKGIREDLLPLIKTSFEKMQTERRKASSRRNARQPRTSSIKTRRGQKS
jgi:hypothetical protein